jgi:hypothetical protein
VGLVTEDMTKPAFKFLQTNDLANKYSSYMHVPPSRSGHCVRFCTRHVLLAATAISIAIETCPLIPCLPNVCGVTMKSDCLDDEDYIRGECTCCLPKCCAACVKTVGT